ncbi:MAG: hypothetical protein ACKOOL_01735 [Novosphingobium sp.]
MKPRSQVRRRGQPLVALGLIMVSWVGARAALWDGKAVGVTDTGVQGLAAPQAVTSRKAVTPSTDKARRPRTTIAPLPRPSTVPPAAPLVAPTLTPPLGDTLPTAPTTQAPIDAPLPPKVAAGHQDLWLQGMSMLPSDPAVAMAAPKPAFPMPAAIKPAGLPHWSADGWLLLRSGGNAFNAPGAGLPGAVIPTGFYGGSQGGLVLRYFLAPGSKTNPALYLRASSGLEYPRGEEVAAGFSLRPIPGVPVRLMAEGRVTRTVSGTIVRPAAALVSELPPARLPLGTRGEAYVQAGYVGGRGATPFVDGQARVEHPLVYASSFELRAGAGAWGGAQRGASRLDVGPTATIAFRLGPTNTRLSADYRWRVSGNAAPGSGPVVTLSAGF